MNIKGNVSYYDMGGRDAEMYRAIDEHLALTKRFSPKGIARSKLKVSLSCMILAGVFIVLAVSAYVYRDSLFGFFTAGPFALMLIIAAIHYALTYGNEPFTEVVRSNSIISADGLENVYNDLMRAKPINKTKFVSGGRYLFLKDYCVYRIMDIQEIYIDTVYSEDTPTYYAAVRIADEMGESTLRLTTLSLFDNKRDKEFDEVTAPIRKMREALMLNGQTS